MPPLAVKLEAHPPLQVNCSLRGWTESQNSRGRRKLLRASNLLFSTSDTSTSKTGFSKPLIAGLVGTATRKNQHSTRLSGSKQGMGGVANLGCFLNSYTTNCGISPLNPTSDCVVSPVSLLPFSSHKAATMPANSRVNSLIDLRFSHHRSGSESPSRALAIRTSMPCGKTRRKI